VAPTGPTSADSVASEGTSSLRLRTTVEKKPPPSFLRQLGEELQRCGANSDAQKEILANLARKHASDVSGLQKMLGRGLSSAGDEQKRMELVGAMATSIAEIDKIEKGLEVLRTLKAAHEDEDIQDILRNPKLKEILQATSDREELRQVLTSADLGVGAQVQSKLHGLRVFFASRGFTSNAFSKEIMVEQGQEEVVSRQDKERIDKLEERSKSVVQNTFKAILKVAAIEESDGAASNPPREAAPSQADAEKEEGPRDEGGAEAVGEAGPRSKGPTMKEEMWKSCKRQMMLSLLSLLFTFVLMWMFKRSGRFDLPMDGSVPLEDIGGQLNDGRFDEL